MSRAPTTAPGEAARLATELILETFRLNGRLLAAGDRLVADLGLTSARWQVLGAVAMAEPPGPIAHLARGMGLTRQNVRRVVGELAEAGLLRLDPNPHHRRAALVRFTARGETVFAAVAARQAPWVTDLSSDLDPATLGAALALLRTLRSRLETTPEEDAADGE
jgi:DNA-binding MarR family transcriptional regulator